VRWIYTVPLRLRSFFRRSRVEDELDERIRFHLDRQTQAFAAQGLSPDEARYAALRAMDGIEQRKEECRDARGLRFVYEALQDLRFALRMMRASPGFTAVAEFSLALGIGATTALFSVVDALVLTRLPALHPGELVMFRAHVPPYRSRTDFPYGEFERFRDETPMFSSLSAINLIDRSTDEDARVRVALAIGASSREIRSMILAESVGLVAVGVAIGVPVALALGWTTRVLSARLFGVSATEPLTLTLATVLMIAVSAAAGFVPASRASRVDPMRALRCE